MKYGTFILLFCIPLALPVKAQSNADNVTIFSVGDRPVTASEFLYLYKKNHTGDAGSDKAKLSEYLDLFVKFKLKVEEARSRKMDTARAFIDEYNSYRAELRKPFLPDKNLVDSLTRLSYDRLREEVRAAHILIQVSADALPADTLAAWHKLTEIRTRVQGGEDFGALAAQYSEDPSARLNRGDLGYFTAFQMVFPFETAAYNTPVGTVSEPFRTNFGYHIVHVTDRRPSRGEVEVSHIMLRTGEGYDNEKARNVVFDIYERLQKGMDWGELCLEFSEDPGSKQNGGRLRPFGVGGMRGVPEFEEVAFNLKNPGDISDPFQSRFGWHIIRLEAKKPVPDFTTLEPTLKQRVSRDERVQLSKKATEEKTRRLLGFAENDVVKKQVFSLADSSLAMGRWSHGSAGSATRVLFQMGGKEFSIADFAAYVIANQKRTNLRPEVYMEQLYDAFVLDVQGELLEEKIKRENATFRWLLNEYYEGILLFEIMEDEVWNRASSDSVGQTQYFSAHAEKYRAGERLRGSIYSSAKRSDIDTLASLLQRGDSVQAAAWVETARIRSETGAFEKKDRVVLEKIPWETGFHLSENNDLHYLVTIEQILPPGPKTFQEARAEVITDYQNHLEEEWLKVLRARYPVKMNKKGLKFLKKELLGK